MQNLPTDQIISKLSDIAKELHQISYNVANKGFDLNNLISTAIGAFLAAIFGVLTALFLEYRKRQQERRYAARVIANELSTSIRTLELLRGVVNQKYPNGQIIGPNIVASSIIQSNSLLIYRSTLMDMLKEDELKVIESAYIEFQKLDDTMKRVIYLDDQYSLSNKKIIKEKLDNAFNMYWGLISSEMVENHMTEIKKVLNILESK